MKSHTHYCFRLEFRKLRRKPTIMNRAAFNPGAASVPSTSVELSLRCENLMDTDVLSKSDPFCVVSLKGSGTQSRFVEVGRTERISDNLHPVWQKKIVLDYNFEERQTLKFDIFDSDSSASNLDDHDYLGSLECSLGEIVTMQSKGFSKPLNGGKGATIHITAEELSSNKFVKPVKTGFTNCIRFLRSKIRHTL